MLVSEFMILFEKCHDIVPNVISALRLTLSIMCLNHTTL